MRECCPCSLVMRVLKPSILKLPLALLVILIVHTSARSQSSHENAAASCAGCHAAQSQEQPHTPMGMGLQLPAADPLFTAHPVLKIQKGPYTYTVETKGSSSIYSVTDGTRTISLPMGCRSPQATKYSIRRHWKRRSAANFEKPSQPIVLDAIRQTAWRRATFTFRPWSRA